MRLVGVLALVIGAIAVAPMAVSAANAWYFRPVSWRRSTTMAIVSTVSLTATYRATRPGVEWPATSWATAQAAR